MTPAPFTSAWPGDDLVPVLGGFNGDMRSDIYWHDPVGTDVLWRAGPNDLFWLENAPQSSSGCPVGYSL